MNKVTMREFREKRIQYTTDRIAHHDLRISEASNRSKDLAKQLQMLGNMSEKPNERNDIILRIVNLGTYLEKLLNERKKLVEELKGKIAHYTAKGTKELKKELGLIGKKELLQEEK